MGDTKAEVPATDFELCLTANLGGLPLVKACEKFGVNPDAYRNWLGQRGIGMPIPRPRNA